MDMNVSVSTLLSKVSLFWEGTETARKNYKQSEVVGFSNLIEINESVKVEFWNSVREDGSLDIYCGIPGLGVSGKLNFSSWEVQEENIPEETYGNHLLIFVNSLIKHLAYKAYQQWCDDTDFLTYLDQENFDKVTELLPKGFGMILDPEVRGYDIQIVDNENDLLYRAAGENVLDFEENKSWDKLKLEIKLAWITIYMNGLAFSDLEVTI